MAALNALDKASHQLLWVGNWSGMESSLIKRAGIPFTGIPAAGVHGVAPYRLPQNIWQLTLGFFSAKRILRHFKPHVLFFTGGYIAVPMAMAGRATPSLLYVPDIEPALSHKLIGRFSSCIALTTETSRQFFSQKKKVVVTGYPVRPDLTQCSREEARSKLMLQPDFPTLLVMGGSRGARSINTALFNILPNLLRLAQIIHITGELDWQRAQEVHASLAGNLASNYHAFPYLHEEMGLALSSADLAISRAGASTLGEYPAFGLPAILIPYPHAWRYQKTNAEYLRQKGAAIMIEDKDMQEKLWKAIHELLVKPNQLESMRQAMRSLAQPGAAKYIAELLCILGNQPTQTNGEPA